MNVYQLVRSLKAEQKAGHGKLEVHVLAHDNCTGETQGIIWDIYHYDKVGDNCPGRDEALYDSLPNEVVYLCM